MRVLKIRGSKKVCSHFMAICLIFLSISGASAQDGGTSLVARPLPECESFIFLETNLLYRAMESSVPEGKGSLMATGEAGYMKNINEKMALGGAIYGAVDDDGSQIGLKFRYRYWLNPRTAIDLSPGLLINGSDRIIEPTFPGFTSSLSFNYYDMIGVTAQINITGYERPYRVGGEIEFETGTQTSVYLGIQFRSLAALSSPLVLLIALASE